MNLFRRRKSKTSIYDDSVPMPKPENPKKRSAAQQEKEVFDSLMKTASRIEPSGLPAFVRALLRPIQTELILQNVEGRGEPPTFTPGNLFFEGIRRSELREYRVSVDVEPEHTLRLGVDTVLPWPWHSDRFEKCMSRIGTANGSPWKQDFLNHDVTLWLPWNIGFVENGNHSTTTGILNCEGSLKPDTVLDLSLLLKVVRTDGEHWYLLDEPVDKVTSGRHAAVFEIGRLL